MAESRLANGNLARLDRPHERPGSIPDKFFFTDSKRLLQVPSRFSDLDKDLWWKKSFLENSSPNQKVDNEKILLRISTSAGKENVLPLSKAGN